MPTQPVKRANQATLWLTLAIVVLVTACSLAGVFRPGLYRETPDWLEQCIGQDMANLLVQVPLLLLSAWFSAKSGRAAKTVWFGAMIANVYTYCIYGFAVHQNILYLVYCAILGLSVFSLFVFAWQHRGAAFRSWYGPSVPRLAPGIFLIVTAVAFLLLWFGSDIPALLNNATPAAIVASGLAVNPVHTLDYAVALPLMTVAGVLLICRHDAGFFLAPAMLTFAVAMCANILVLMVHSTTGSNPAPFAIVAVVAAIAVFSALLLWWLTAKMVPDPA